jgi:hypothetical protein
VTTLYVAEYAAKLGVNIDDLYISQPNSGEEALEIGGWFLTTIFCCMKSVGFVA